jgi:hypothetical protein
MGNLVLDRPGQVSSDEEAYKTLERKLDIARWRELGASSATAIRFSYTLFRAPSY